MTDHYIDLLEYQPDAIGIMVGQIANDCLRNKLIEKAFLLNASTLRLVPHHFHDASLVNAAIGMSDRVSHLMALDSYLRRDLLTKEWLEAMLQSKCNPGFNDYPDTLYTKNNLKMVISKTPDVILKIPPRFLDNDLIIRSLLLKPELYIDLPIEVKTQNLLSLFAENPSAISFITDHEFNQVANSWITGSVIFDNFPAPPKTPGDFFTIIDDINHSLCSLYNNLPAENCLNGIKRLYLYALPNFDPKLAWEAAITDHHKEMVMRAFPTDRLAIAVNDRSLRRCLVERDMGL